MWARTGEGVFSFRFRFLKREARPTVGFIFFNRQRSYNAYSSAKGLRELLDAGHEGWFRMVGHFEVTPEGHVILRRWEVWPEKSRRDLLAAKNWSMPTQVRIEDICGVGLSARGCSVEFRELKLEEAVQGATVPAKAGELVGKRE